MDLVEIVRVIVEKALRYVSPEWLTTGLDHDAILLSAIVPFHEIDKFVDRLGVGGADGESSPG